MLNSLIHHSTAIRRIRIRSISALLTYRALPITFTTTKPFTSTLSSFPPTSPSTSTFTLSRRHRSSVTSNTGAAVPVPKPFPLHILSKIIIANRGEIACRIIDTCKKLNIRTVAVYSEADRNARHVVMADEAYCIGPSPASESYLLGSKVLEIALKTNAQALHPGYGFLSENSKFAQLCADNGVTFMGPPVSAIEAMGSKSNSKEIMLAAGVPCTPGYHGSDQDPDQLLLHAREVGYPVLIKAVMGGGGKGMRLVEKEENFLADLISCRRESQNAFGDTDVLLERYLTAPRHVELQIFGDTHGNAVHLHERDCSIQRRHQKVLEEAPAPNLSPELRKSMGEAAVKAAKAVGYVGAGTVEFLMEANTEDFFFCEMNTRLQVEHPVTEMVTGIDLVEWQLRIAAGEELPILDQDKIVTKGHAIEARIYAENPAKEFLPATGKLVHLLEPTGPGIRVETGIRQGDEVSVFYDPMISKLIAYGPDRESAVNKLITSLKNYQVVGLPTNMAFVEKCANHPAFRLGGVDTGFLQKYAEDVHIKDDYVVSETARTLGAFALMQIRNDASKAATPSSPWSSLSPSWRMYGRVEQTVNFQVGDDESPALLYANTDGSYDVKIGDNTHTVKGSYNADTKVLEAWVGDLRFVASAVISAGENGAAEIALWQKEDGKTFENDEYYATMVVKGNDVSDAASGGGGSGNVMSPMPGKVVAVHKKTGDFVEEGEVVMILEAMKMEHSIVAPVSGVVGSLGSEVGELVSDGFFLFVVEKEKEGKVTA